MKQHQEKSSRPLPVLLGRAELDKKKTELAHTVERLRKVEARKRATVREYGAEIKELKQAINTLSETIATGAEDREVVTTTSRDYEQGLETTTRDDTGEVIDTRSLKGEQVPIEAPARPAKPS